MKDILRAFYFTIILLATALSISAQNLPALKWKLHPQDGTHSFAQLSSPGLNVSVWVPAVVPGTVFHSYVVAGKEKNPDYAENIYKVDKAKYNRPYWYRAEFTAKQPTNGRRLWLNFNGINKRAEIYFNGKHIGTTHGLALRAKYDITNRLNKNKPNAIAVLIIPPIAGQDLANRQAPTYLSSGSWDWMPAVPGLNSGITDTVALTYTGPVVVQDVWVRAKLPDLKQAQLSVNVQLKNTANKAVTGKVKLLVSPGNIVVNGPTVTLKANSLTPVKYDHQQFTQLNIKNPKVWWPNGLGAQPLYTCKVSFETSGNIAADAVSTNFGIRKVSADTTTLKGPLRVYINNVPVLLKGGNWGMSDYMLKVRGKDYEPRIRMHREMNFNMIRNWTGEVTDEAFYQYCDKYGIMVWDDFWLNNFGPIDSLDAFKANAIDKVKKMRSHPSIVIWCGANEGLPGGGVNSALNQAIQNAITDNDADDRLYLPRSNAGVTNPNFSIHGGSKVMSGSGIWANVDPKTYFTDPKNGYVFSKNSWGMRSELGAAAFVNIESFKKFMPKDYWVPPTDTAVKSKTNMWARHYFSTDGALGGGTDPVKYINDINKSYGKPNTIEEFCTRAQLLNVETNKAMFEAWNDHLWNDATGLLIWMSQSAYPSMIWQTYDYYYDLTGAYFGAKKACEPVHIQWNPATNSVKVINNKNYDLNDLVASAEVYNVDGKLVPAYSLNKTLSVKPTSATEAFMVFKGDKLLQLSDVHFLKLKLHNSKGELLSDNFYWIGNTYLDHTALNTMPSVSKQLSVGQPVISSSKDGIYKVLTYRISNNSKTTAAFAIRAQLLDAKGEQILPAIFNDGYFSLMQGESKTLSVEVDPQLLKGKYSLSLRPYNN